MKLGLSKQRTWIEGVWEYSDENILT